ncbi:MAG: SUMF1/EgtB/PvdO family nonheme iron enzyme [Devosia sp.]
MLGRRITGGIVALLALFWTLAAIGAPNVVPKTTEDERVRTRNEIASQMDKSYALLIGISEFDNPVWPGLHGVDEEIGRMATLFERNGFQIAPESQVSGRLTQAALKQKVSDFIAAHDGKADHRLIIYIATHGFADPENVPSGGKADGFLIASDSGPPERGRVANGYSVLDLSGALYDVDAQHIFVFLDSCFSGAMLPKPTRAANEALKNKPTVALSEATADWTLHLLSQSARMILTAGSNDQTVPDTDNPFPAAIEDALAGQADGDGDGLILGSELAQFVRGRVARETRLSGHPNDPVFAVIPRIVPPDIRRPDAPPDVNYAQLGDFIFLTPGGAAPLAQAGIDEQEALLAERQARLGGNEFTECVDCPTMTRLPGLEANIALARTEVTYAEWDACFRAMGCRRYLPDEGLGRGDRPAGNMTWLDAVDYVTWLSQTEHDTPFCEGYRLPSAREWLAAATYSTAGPTSWQAAVADSEPVCLDCGTGMDGVAAQRTGSTPPSDAGLYDMIGNLWEWVDDDASVMLAGDPEGIDRNAPTVVTVAADKCDADALGVSDRCADGVVMGGSYATSRAALPLSAWGTMPRTGLRYPYTLPTVGLRVACTLAPAQ